MKLTEIAIDGYQGTQKIELQNLGSGLNVVLSPHTMTRQSITSFILDVLYGPDRNAAPTTVWPNGHLQIQSGGQHYRLARPHSNQIGELAITDLHGSNLAHRTPDLLSQLDSAAVAAFFCVPLDTYDREWNSFVNQLFSQFDLSAQSADVDMPFAPDQHSYQTWKHTADSRAARFDSARREIESLNNERDRLISETNRISADCSSRLAAIEHELAGLQSRHDSMAASIQAERHRLADLDRQIGDLTRVVGHRSSNVQQIPVTRSSTNFLALFFERLDEVDNQIRRWRNVQTDIQEQRLRLRDEMVTHGELSIDSHDHPYHDARDIALALEARINRTEEAARTWEPPSTHAENTRLLSTLFQEMRGDLQALCSELGRQYKHVRHKATVAELKQLRRCYHEMDENVKRLLVRRESIIDEIRRLDPAGAEAIVQGDQQFTNCAEKEGYLAARQRFVSGPPVAELQTATEYHPVQPDLESGRTRLIELQSSRVATAERLANMESDLSSSEPRRKNLIDEGNYLSGKKSPEHEVRLREVDALLQRLEAERIRLHHQIEADQPWLNWQPSYLLTDASRYLQQLSAQNLTQVWMDRGHHVNVQHKSGPSGRVDMLTATEQSIVRLSLSMAAVDQLALRGIRLPMLIGDAGDLTSTQHLIPALASFCRNGHQLVLLTANRSLIEQSRDFPSTIFELPDTNITPPTWYPESPALPRQDFPTPPAPPTSYNRTEYTRDAISGLNPIPTEPEVSREWITPRPAVALSESSTFIPTPLVAAPRSACTRDTMLQDIDLVESIYLTPMESLGVRTVGQLLDMDLETQEAELSRRGFNLDQIDRWQAQAWLLICLPEISTCDVRVLVGSGIDQPELILQLTASDILERIRRYLDSSAGRRSNATYSQFNTLRLRGWADCLRKDNGWRTYARSRRKSHSPRTRTSPTTRHARGFNANRNTASARTSQKPRTPRATRAKNKSPSRYHFYLNITDNIESAPSLGPRTAEKFYALGINTIGEFLDSDAVDMAAQLNNRRMSAKVLDTWQHQSRLMCAIPNLRAHDVQFLVGCGITEPSGLAAMDAEELLNVVSAFVKTREGLRILRNGKQPDLEEVTDWIDAAKNVRSLKAA